MKCLYIANINGCQTHLLNVDCPRACLITAQIAQVLPMKLNKSFGMQNVA